MGGMAPYGTRHQVVDENGKRRMTLKPRQRKALSTDKVIYALGPPAEVEVVERVFRDYAIRRKKMTEIARWLNDEKRKHRSEEHTSELQSLMRISYAVFCLKKKKDKPNRPAT